MSILEQRFALVQTICETFNNDTILKEAGLGFSDVNDGTVPSFWVNIIRPGYPIAGKIRCDVICCAQNCWEEDCVFDPHIVIDLNRHDFATPSGRAQCAKEKLGYRRDRCVFKGVDGIQNEFHRIASMYDVEEENRAINEKTVHDERKCCIDVFGVVLCTFGTEMYESVRKMRKNEDLSKSEKQAAESAKQSAESTKQSTESAKQSVESSIDSNISVESSIDSNISDHVPFDESKRQFVLADDAIEFTFAPIKNCEYFESHISINMHGKIICDGLSDDLILKEAGFNFEMDLDGDIVVTIPDNGYLIVGKIICCVWCGINCPRDCCKNICDSNPHVSIELLRYDTHENGSAKQPVGPLYTGEKLGYDGNARVFKGLQETLNEFHRIVSMKTSKKTSKKISKKTSKKISKKASNDGEKIPAEKNDARVNYHHGNCGDN